MPYQISRDGQLYGPYSLEDLQRYIASGNVLFTDLAKSEEMTEWVPVSQIIAAASGPAPAATIEPPAYPSVPAYSAPAYTPAGSSPYPDPPNLHWGLVLLFGFLTCGVFSVVWDLVQVLWAKRVEPQTNAVLWFAIYCVFWLFYIGSSIGLAMRGETSGVSPAAGLFWLLFLVFVTVYRFTMKATLEQHFNGPDPVGLRLSGVMTFFFGGIYFQYHFNRINQIKQSTLYRGY